MILKNNNKHIPSHGFAVTLFLKVIFKEVQKINFTEFTLAVMQIR
jgi:hypothetical protein